MSATVKHIKHIKAFEEYTKLISSTPCIVKFTANWCGPCKRLAPLYEKLAAEHSSTVTFVEIDIDQAEEITNHENIQSIPLVYFFNQQLVRDLTIRGYNPSGLENNIKSFATSVVIVNEEQEQEQTESQVMEVRAGPPDASFSHLVLDDIVEVDTDDDSEDSAEGEEGNHEYGEDCEILIEKTIPEDMINN